MKTSEAIKITGTLSKPSKMPGFSYGIPAKECKTGSKLRKVPGSTCYNCYALKGCYVFKVVQEAQYKRLASLKREPWTTAMAAQINSKKVKFFRWHDSGDVQDLDHLNKIYEVCRLTPSVKHWMPTREAWTRDHAARAPKNLTVRFSMPMVNQPAAGSWPNTSTVSSSHSVNDCPAFRTDKAGTVHSLEEFKVMTKETKKDLDLGHCGSCRNCWNKKISNVSYGKH